MHIKFENLNDEYLEWARQLHNDSEVLYMLTDTHVVSKEEQLLWFKSLKKSNSSKRLLVFIDDISVGIIRLDSIDAINKSICVGLDIHKDFRGRGYARPIYNKLLTECFNEDINRVWLMVASFNLVARHLYESLGFVYEGTQREALYRKGAYHDYILMSVLKKEFLK